ncbi:hypothetical protein GQ53DRAFT_18224 [Thozetella sp. PMI_491]|nr:hypothetical protein GQ53DRAFT_18224 [Thozetella sp. PMI_491]
MRACSSPTASKLRPYPLFRRWLCLCSARTTPQRPAGVPKLSLCALRGTSTVQFGTRYAVRWGERGLEHSILVHDSLSHRRSGRCSGRPGRGPRTLGCQRRSPTSLTWGRGVPRLGSWAASSSSNLHSISSLSFSLSLSLSPCPPQKSGLGRISRFFASSLACPVQPPAGCAVTVAVSFAGRGGGGGALAAWCCLPDYYAPPGR